MNITFLIGNGFDVGIGMSSRFKDFFPIYQFISKDKALEIRKLSEEIKSDLATWADFELAIGMYTLKFDKNNKQEFLDQIKDFELEFIEYLKEQEKHISYNNKTKISSVIIKALTMYFSPDNLAVESSKMISNVYANHKKEEHRYNFINFNYTNTLKSCLETISDGVVARRKYNDIEKIDKIDNVIHVHGKSDLHPLIGVDNVNQIANKELAKDVRFTRYIVKPLMNQFLRNSNNLDTTTVIKKSKIICIYGMSLGASDLKWWSLLLSWLHNDSERQLIIFEYDDKYTTTTPFAWIEKEDFILDKLNSYNASTNIDVDKLIPRIHIAVHKNIFQMDLTKEHREFMDNVIEEVITKA